MMASYEWPTATDASSGSRQGAEGGSGRSWGGSARRERNGGWRSRRSSSWGSRARRCSRTSPGTRPRLTTSSRRSATAKPTIDRYQANTGDKAFYRGHWYSARAPGLALFAVPFYELLNAVDASGWAKESPALRNEDEMVDLVGLWGNVLPAIVLLLLVWRVGERLQPGYGVATAITLGLGTIVLPLSTLLFAHILAACLGFAAFALLLRERDGPPRAWQLAVAGVLAGYAVCSEYPMFLVACVLGLLRDLPAAARAGGSISRAGQAPTSRAA